MCSARTRLFNTTWLRPLPLQEKNTVELFPLRYKCSTERGNICTLEQAWSVRANRWAGDSCRKLYQDFALFSRLSLTAATKMPKCPKCEKEVYFAEKVTSLGKDWHRPCLRCEKCSKTLSPGSHAEHEGKPYCNKPCYAALFGPKGKRIQLE
uniref:LIM zinc-binding domain-containing protein n=1 Tax=Astatotilapia calliptera TaxID=8154 RepID=A0AAX7SQW1_ASTCA